MILKAFQINCYISWLGASTRLPWRFWLFCRADCYHKSAARSAYSIFQSAGRHYL